MIKKLILLLLLPFLFSDKPLLIYHQKKMYYPCITSYLESDFGGNTSLVMDYLDTESKTLIKGSWVLKTPFQGLSIDLSLPHASTGPSFIHWLGTIPTGQDTLSYALHALYINVYTACILTVISYYMGCFLGMLHAKSNRSANLLMQLYLEVSRSIPLVMLIILCLKKSIVFFLFLFSATQWTKYAYLARIQSIPLLKKPYIIDAQYQGISTIKLLYKHLFPHIRRGTNALLPHTFLNYFSIITSLNYFDITLFPNSPSLGKLVFYAQQYPSHTWILFTCCLIFFGISLCALHIPKLKYCQSE